MENENQLNYLFHNVSLKTYVIFIERIAIEFALNSLVSKE